MDGTVGDMKMVELRAALEKRNLDKSGTKAILIERLKNAMAEDETESPSPDPESPIEDTEQEMDDIPTYREDGQNSSPEKARLSAEGKLILSLLNKRLDAIIERLTSRDDKLAQVEDENRQLKRRVASCHGRPYGTSGDAQQT